MRDINATVVVDLKPSIEEIYRRLQKDARWGINKAEKEDLVIEKIEENSKRWLGAWGDFYPIYAETMKNAGIRLETLEHLKEYADVLFLCKKEGKIIAGASLDVVDDVPKLSRNGSLKEFQRLQPNNLLYWECIKWSRIRGYKTLDLGGWQINPDKTSEGVNKFKERWGEVIYYEKEYPVHKAIGRRLIRRFKFLRLLYRWFRARGR